MNLSAEFRTIKSSRRIMSSHCLHQRQGSNRMAHADAQQQVAAALQVLRAGGLGR
jgi:hypothetical protein